VGVRARDRARMRFSHKFNAAVSECVRWILSTRNANVCPTSLSPHHTTPSFPSAGRE